MKKSHAALALCLTLVAAVPAQVKSPKPAKLAKSAQKVHLRSGTFNLDFSGGTVGNLLTLLLNVMPSRPNILVSPTANNLLVPPLKLTGVDLRSLFKALPTFMSAHTAGKKVELRVDFGIGSLNNTIITLYTYQRRVNTARVIPDRTEVINVADLLAGGELKITDLVTAIETAWAMNSQGKTMKNPQLKFHKETNLLLVKGSIAAVSLVKNVTRQLQITQSRKLELTRLKKENNKLKTLIIDLKRELAKLKKTRSSKQ